ncbi:MAG: phospholipase D-like domain-containing protein [Chloroflexota bacterium]|nr:phospholipase D-like domain-containing protein [Chloroflexota bacterium]
MEIERPPDSPFSYLTWFFGVLMIAALLVVVGCSADPTAVPTSVGALPTNTFVLASSATSRPSTVAATRAPATTAATRVPNTAIPAASNTPIVVATRTFAPPPTLLPVTRAATSISAATVPATSAPFIVPTIASTRGADGLSRFVLPLGSGAGRGFWNVFFNAPSGSRSASTYVGGIDVPLAQTIAATRRTLEIAAFEWNNPLLTSAVLDAVRRGVVVRMVVDSEHTFDDDDSTIQQLADAGVQIVRDNRSALMHNKFVIFDSTTVLTGSWNFTINDTYRNNNNAVYLRAPQAVAAYRSEFEEMFTLRSFGPSASLPTLDGAFTVDGIGIEVYFSPDDVVLDRILNAIAGARTSIRFLAFSFTEDSIGDALVAKRARTSEVTVQGVFESTGSETRFSELTKLFCAGMDVRQDGGSFVLHHKVFIIDSRIVLTGSFNFSANATNSNDENLIVIDDPTIAALYIEEFDKRLAQSRVPTLTCAA